MSTFNDNLCSPNWRLAVDRLKTIYEYETVSLSSRLAGIIVRRTLTTQSNYNKRLLSSWSVQLMAITNIKTFNNYKNNYPAF